MKEQNARRTVLESSQFYLGDDGRLFRSPSKSPNSRKSPRQSRLSPLCVPLGQRPSILLAAHGLSDHQGVDCTLGLLFGKYWFRRWRSMLLNGFTICPACQHRKSPHSPSGSVLTSTPEQNVFQRVAVDIVGPFVPAGYRYARLHLHFGDDRLSFKVG